MLRVDCYPRFVLSTALAIRLLVEVLARTLGNRDLSRASCQGSLTDRALARTLDVPCPLGNRCRTARHHRSRVVGATAPPDGQIVRLQHSTRQQWSNAWDRMAS